MLTTFTMHSLRAKSLVAILEMILNLVVMDLKMVVMELIMVVMALKMVVMELKMMLMIMIAFTMNVQSSELTMRVYMKMLILAGIGEC